LRVPAAGPVVVKLRSVLPPAAPVRTTAAQIAEFAAEMARRPSRFPGGWAALRQWQSAWRGKLAGWLMKGGLPTRVPLAAVVRGRQDCGWFVLWTVEYQTQADRRSTLLISLPKGVAKPPLLLALHGHEAAWGQADAQAYRMGHNDDFCAHFAERGWAALQPATMNHALQHPGWTLQGEWTWDAMVALDYARALPEVDSGRIAVCGTIHWRTSGDERARPG